VASEFEARRAIVEIGRRIWERGYVAANDGNLSVRLPGDRIVVTPTGRSKGFLEAGDLVVVTLDGAKLAGALEPTSELAMHLFAYRRRPDARAVVHAHPPKATAFAAAGVPLAECVLPEVILTLGSVPLAGYATPSTQEVPRSLEDLIGGYSAMLLRNHGVLTLGSDLEQAYFRMETVEHFAEITLAAKMLGGPSPLSREEVRKLLHVREKLGIVADPPACVECGACESSGAGPPSGPAAGRAEPAAAAPAGERGGADEDAIVREVVREVERRLGTGRKPDPKKGYPS
jgi:L-fuculose-phosphate aldolase